MPHVTLPDMPNAPPWMVHSIADSLSHALFWLAKAGLTAQERADILRALAEREEQADAD